MTAFHPYLIYPAVMFVALWCHSLMDKLDLPLWSSTYLPITIAGLIILTLEQIRPYQTEWKPDSRDIKTDTIYLAVVQIILPVLVKTALIFSILGITNYTDQPKSAFWPHDLPIAIQALLMLLVADFLRYWLHRLAHNNKYLWSLHAVHHSPKKLYWLNTSRFHPLEKPLQMLVDTLPFMLMGVQPEVIALYYLIYAVNGFFQHANINYKMGWLNLILSTGELHRWHHSVDVQESNKNLGNTLIIWDILFGTWYLPENSSVTRLGLINARYPQSFPQQLKAPFIRSLDKRSPDTSGHSLSIRKIVLNIAGKLIANRGIQNQNKIFQNICSTQLRTLTNIQRKQQNIFSRLSCLRPPLTLDQFQRKFQIGSSDRKFDARNNNYESMLHKPVTYLAKTSGTTGSAKYLPKNLSDLKTIQQQQRLSTAMMLKFRPEAFKGKILHITGEAIEGRNEQGVPFGSISGVMADNTHPLIKPQMLLDNSILSIRNALHRDLLILRIALEHKNISLISTANPSTLVRFQQLLNQHRDAFLGSLRNGHLFGLIESMEFANSYSAYCSTQSARADELQRFNHTNFTIANCWPDIAIINTWTNGSCAIALKSLQHYLPENCDVIDLGLIASEARMTIINPELDKNFGLPLIQDNFYEFIETGDYESGVRRTLMLHELVANKEYYIIVTTASGLHRYFMNDIIEIKWKQNLPLLRFIRKGRDMTSITGEKLHQDQVTRAIQTACKKFNLECDFYLALAHDNPARYELLLECGSPNPEKQAIAHYVDLQLSKLNTEYAAKRQSGRLQSINLAYLQPNTHNAYKEYCTQTLKQRDTQYKPLFMHYVRSFTFPFQNYILAETIR